MMVALLVASDGRVSTGRCGSSSGRDGCGALSLRPRASLYLRSGYSRHRWVTRVLRLLGPPRMLAVKDGGTGVREEDGGRGLGRVGISSVKHFLRDLRVSVYPHSRFPSGTLLRLSGFIETG